MGGKRLVKSLAVIIDSPSVTTCCVMSKEIIERPFFLDNDNVTSDSYQAVLIHYRFSCFRA